MRSHLVLSLFTHFFAFLCTHSRGVQVIHFLAVVKHALTKKKRQIELYSNTQFVPQNKHSRFRL
jgi:hypothetical protein